jgi:hypothetical protein
MRIGTPSDLQTGNKVHRGQQDNATKQHMKILETLGFVD